jgi:hypothetical protein
LSFELIRRRVVLNQYRNRINRYHPVVLEQKNTTAAKTTIFSKSKKCTIQTNVLQEQLKNNID